MGVFPDFVEKIPTRDYGIEGLIVHVDHTSTGTVYFVTAEKEIVFPRHSHAEQWTVVASGSCTLSMDGVETTYQKGDVYKIPAGHEHQIVLHAGYAEIDWVDDPRDGVE